METGLYYYGARYMDAKTSHWLSTDPALGEYIPGAPINDEVKKQNQNLPGMGGVFNYVNMHLYHYAGNNPVKYLDPDGREVDLSKGAENSQQYILDGINEASYTQFKLDENKKLQIDDTKVNENGSKTFSKDVEDAIKSEENIEILITSIYIVEGERENVIGGINFHLEDDKRRLIYLHPQGGSYQTNNNETLQASPIEVLIHELSGHVMPQIRGKIDNAVRLENIIRGELNPKLPLRKEDVTHSTHRISN